jgi:uncharacterized membrane protein YfcA
VGGGILMVPLQFFALTYIGVDPDLALRIAIGTSLAIIIPTGLFSAYNHHKKLNTILKPGLILGIFGLLGGIIGGIVSSYIPSDILELILGIFLCIIAIYMLFNQKINEKEYKLGTNGEKEEIEKEKIKKEEVKKEEEKLSEINKKNPSLNFGIVFGLIIGFASGILGVGGGIFLIPVLIFILKYSMKEAIGISSVFIALTSVGGTISYIATGWGLNSFPYSLGYISLINLIGIAIFSIPLAYLGAKIVYKVPEKFLQCLFAIIMLYMGIKMLGLDPLSYLLGI